MFYISTRCLGARGCGGVDIAVKKCLCSSTWLEQSATSRRSRLLAADSALCFPSQAPGDNGGSGPN